MSSPQHGTVVSLVDEFAQRNCPSGSIAMHQLYGMVSILAVDGLRREIQYVIDRRSTQLGDNTPDEVLYEEEIELGTTWIHVSELEQRSPIRDLELLFPRDWRGIVHSLEERAKRCCS